nr:DUF4979 domain-containing protein [uncultured Flavobacterium sp.]
MKLIIKQSVKLMLLLMTLVFFNACEDTANFKIYEYPEQTVTGFSPSIGKIGQLVTITGKDFGDNPKAVKIYFGATLATIESITDTEIVAKVPDGISGPLSIKVWTNTIVTDENFTILPSAKIEGITPAIGIEGAIVKINGANFGTDKNAIAVKFNGGTLDAEIVSVTDTQITVKAPVGVQPGFITVTIDSIVLQAASFNAGYLNHNFNTNGDAEGWVLGQTNNATLVSGGYFNVTFDPNSFLGTAKRRADFKRSAGAVLHPGNFPILAIKFNKPAAMNLILDTNLGSYGNGNNKWTGIIVDKNNNGKDIYYYDLTKTFGASNLLSQTASTTLTIFQWKVADITSPELGYSVDWVKTFTSLAELQAYANQ